MQSTFLQYYFAELDAAMEQYASLPQLTKTEKLVECEKLGFYFSPFMWGTPIMDAIVNEVITFDKFCENEENWYAQEYEGKEYKYTLEEMQMSWRMIEYQRLVAKAALLVHEGKFCAINPAMRFLRLEV